MHTTQNYECQVLNDSQLVTNINNSQKHNVQKQQLLRSPTHHKAHIIKQLGKTLRRQRRFELHLQPKLFKNQATS